MTNSSPSRPDWPRLASRLLERAWAGGLSSRPSLDPEAIIAAAARREGDRPSDGCWRERLSILCAALDGEAALNPLGRTIAHGQLVKLVAARVRAERLFARHSAIRRRPLDAPLVIVGQMRSGTTRMHRLLACDPHFACNRLFEQLDPVPPRRRPFGLDRRRLSASLVGAGLHLLEPRLAGIHPSRPDAAEEEFGLHAYSIWGPLFEGQWRVPSFANHVEQADPAPVYREFADLLRLIGWARGDDAQRPWLLKAPQFSQELGALLDRFPDARLVVLHRPAEEIVASGASLVWHHARMQSDAVSREGIGAEWLRKTRLREQRLANVLAARPDVERVELSFADVSRDWRRAIARIYAMLGRRLSPRAEAAMARFIAGSRDHQQHRYSLGDFGLDASKVREALS